MHTKVHPDSPHGQTRYGFACQHVPAGSAHLDVGCNDGWFLDSLCGKGIARLVGVDVSRSAVTAAHEKFPHLDVRRISCTVPLPFEDDTFTSVTILDVLEHIHDQRELLDECRRILKDDGTLIVTVPGQHIFSFLDMGNFKFLFPELHRWWYCRHHTTEEYRLRYVSNPEGLVGDLSDKKRWHEHFTPNRLAGLLAGSGFRVVRFDGSGLFTRPLRILRRLLGRPKCLQTCMERLMRWDAGRFEAMNLFCLAKSECRSSTFPDERESSGDVRHV